ncbi:MAG: hypothetical protein GXY25_21685 [Pirellulaceae bacterium]|nr:hypothetical protein [Thermoguttaceae bacterium]MDI9444105.1 hypothetical protein [Planctomycetota bacterium]NLZ03136.1 hypothetical protein [Pirellulaceae bacterium]
MVRFRTCPFLRALAAIAFCLACLAPSAPGGEPPALNPFAPVKTDREDAAPGYLELSDGSVRVGNIYMTRDKRLKVYDDQTQRQREIPLRAVRQIDCNVLKEWMEKEWRFKELALNEKYFTGREYPSRECAYTVTLQDGRTITGPLAEIIYVRPFVSTPSGPTAYRPDAEAEKFLLHKRQKGDPGTDLKSLVYVKTIRLGEEALAEGRKRARASRPKPAN